MSTHVEDVFTRQAIAAVCGMEAASVAQDTDYTPDEAVAYFRAIPSDESPYYPENIDGATRGTQRVLKYAIVDQNYNVAGVLVVYPDAASFTYCVYTG